jgi:hypothetical protein
MSDRAQIDLVALQHAAARYLELRSRGISPTHRASPLEEHIRSYPRCGRVVEQREQASSCPLPILVLPGLMRALCWVGTPRTVGRAGAPLRLSPNAYAACAMPFEQPLRGGDVTGEDRRKWRKMSKSTNIVQCYRHKKLGCYLLRAVSCGARARQRRGRSPLAPLLRKPKARSRFRVFLKAQGAGVGGGGGSFAPTPCLLRVICLRPRGS